MKQRLRFGSLVVTLASSSALAATGGGDATFPLEGIPSVMFSHDSHVGKAKQKCSDCHYALYANRAQRKAVGMSGMRQGKSCGLCTKAKLPSPSPPSRTARNATSRRRSSNTRT